MRSSRLWAVAVLLASAAAYGAAFVDPGRLADPAAGAGRGALAPSFAVAPPILSATLAAAPLSAALTPPLAPAVALDPRNAEPQRLAQLATVGLPWDAENLAVARLPVVLGRLDDGASFSAPAPAGAQAQSLAIKRPGTGVRLPPALEQFREAVERVVAFERAINPLFDGSHVYLTFSQGDVEPGRTQRRSNAHTDGWPRDAAAQARPVDRVYLVSDALPTEFFDQPFAAPRGVGFSEVHDALERQTDPGRVVRHAPYEIVMLDGYTVHRSPAAPSRLRRTFLKLQVTTADFGMAKNTPNPLFGETAPAPDPILPAGGSVPLRERLREEWDDYAARRRAAGSDGVVDDPAGLFVELFNIGKLWWSATRWGPRVSPLALEQPARRAARRFFSSPPELRAAADGFVERALDPATGDSANQRRKLLRETFLAASTLPAARAAALFDAAGRVGGNDAATRRARSADVVARFGRAAERVVAHRLALDPAFNVVGVVVAGSYVDGTARPGSDLDYAALTRDGTTRDVRLFLEELAVAAPAEGWPPSPDWERFANVMTPQTARAFVRERPARVFSPLAAVRAAGFAGPTLEAGRPLDGWLYRASAPLFRLWVRLRLP